MPYSISSLVNVLLKIPNRLRNVVVWYLASLVIDVQKHTQSSAAELSGKHRSQFSRLLSEHQPLAIDSLKKTGNSRSRSCTKDTVGQGSSMDSLSYYRRYAARALFSVCSKRCLRALLLNIAQEQKIEFQILLNRFGAEQFLFRLSESPYKDKFIFKGGSLLAYLIETDRKTKDLDFSIKQMSKNTVDSVEAIKEILEVPVDDGIVWNRVDHKPLPHPDMPYPGIRITCDFLLGKMRGQVRMDLAIGDSVKGVKIPLPRLRYKNSPLIGETFVPKARTTDFSVAYSFLPRRGHSPRAIFGSDGSVEIG